jgi:hypothetical protein
MKRLFDDKQLALLISRSLMAGSGRKGLQKFDERSDDEEQVNFGEIASLTREDKDHYRKILDQTESLANENVVTLNEDPSKDRVKLLSARTVEPAGRALPQIDLLPESELDKFAVGSISVDPRDVFELSLGDKLGGLLTMFDSDDAIRKVHDIDRIRGEARVFLETSYGAEMLLIWNDLKYQTEAVEFERRVGKFFTLLVQAIREWYDVIIIEDMLTTIAKIYDGDPTLEKMVDQVKNTSNNGIYKDLFLHDKVQLNPYGWLDNTIENRIADATENVVEAIEGRLHEIVSAYQEYSPSVGAPLVIDSFAKSNLASNHHVQKDMSRSTAADRQSGIKSYNQGVANIHKQGFAGAIKVSKDIRRFDTVPFTMRRAFPAFRMYFIEEDNQGIFRRFDDFYNYNAIMDIQMIKYKNRPSVMVVTMSNLFGHLDGKTFDDMASRDDIKDAIRAAQSEGRVPTITREVNGVEQTIDLSGYVSGLREIMLKPGTKIVMKMGYENDPDNMNITFAGQVTEVSGGDIMTIVCQDWMSELFSPAVPGSVTTDPQWYKDLFMTSSTWDQQGTTSARNVIASCLTQKSALHFGHWQLKRTGEDANYFGYRKENSWVTKPFKNFLSEQLSKYTDNTLYGNSRALINVHPEVQPFYTAFGMNMKAVYPEKEEVASQNLWELIEMQRRLLPNHIAAVRPYGSGDATLYLGPPWGVYVANEFRSGDTEDATNSLLTEHHRDLFRYVIKHNLTVPVANYGYLLDKINWGLSIRRDFRRLVGRFSSTQEDHITYVAVHQLMKDLASVIVEEGDFKGVGLDVDKKYVRQSYQRYNRNKNEVWEGNVDEGNFVLSDALGEQLGGDLNAHSPDHVIDNWYKAFMSTSRRGGAHDDEEEHAIFIDLQSQLQTLMQSVAWQRSKTEKGFDPKGLIQRAIRPVRQWHLVTSKHHIIANNIQLNNNFANEVMFEDTTVSYDANLTDKRTRYMDGEVPEQIEKEPYLSLYMASVLADELRTMYRGQLILAGNPEINPHDIIMIYDDVRHMHGSIEVAKVTHTFNQEMGFISIVEPHLVVEQADYSMSAAVMAANDAFARDFVDLSSSSGGRTLLKYLSPVAATPEAQSEAINEKNTPALDFGPGEFAVNYLFTQVVAGKDARSHPLTICPLVRRQTPWVAGIDGANGAGLLGVIYGKIVVGLGNINRVLSSIGKTFEDVSDGFETLTDTVFGEKLGGGLSADSKLDNDD